MTPHEMTLARQALARLKTAAPAPDRMPAKRSHRPAGEMPVGVFQVGPSFRVLFSRSGRKYDLGRFDTLEEAAEVAALFREDYPAKPYPTGWSEAEDAVLREFAPTLTARQIGLKVGRTGAGVQQRAKKLNISLRQSR